MQAKQALMGDRGTALATDGQVLDVTRYVAQGVPWATLVVAGAMGVRQDFYGPLARFLSANGIHVLTFDYRGSGWSRPPSLRGFEATLSDWALKDLEAMLGESRRPAPHLPVLFLGHSLGGQLLGVLERNTEVAAALNVSAGSGYFRLNDRIPVEVRIFWFLAVPLLTPLCGYFPGKKLKMVGDLPRGVAWQWRRWCLHREYLLCESQEWRARFDRVTAPLLSCSFEDDDIITRRGVDELTGYYRHARIERRHVAPADIGARRIGHFGFFAERSRDTLWSPALEWLRTHTRQEAPCPATMAS